MYREGVLRKKEVSALLFIWATVDADCARLSAYADLQAITVNQEHSFTHASFNDIGTLLYAWAFSSPDDCLYTWRIDEQSQGIIVSAESEGYYPSVRVDCLGACTFNG